MLPGREAKLHGSSLDGRVVTSCGKSMVDAIRFQHVSSERATSKRPSERHLSDTRLRLIQPPIPTNKCPAPRQGEALSAGLDACADRQLVPVVIEHVAFVSSQAEWLSDFR